MRLVGMLDSPYVRRTAIGLEALGVAFAHEPVSVFSTFARFQAINPVVKAPTLVCDDGTLLMDSSLILQFAEAGHAGGRSLWPAEAAARQQAFAAVGLALAACEKAVQTVYEIQLRPPSARHAPWLDRLRGQMLAACAGLEQSLAHHPALFGGVNQASITAAVVWQFIQSQLAGTVPAADHAGLAELSARMEALPLFRRYPPTGPGVNPPGD